MKQIILDLCGGTGAWSRPYAEAGYDVRLVTLPDHDVRGYKAPPNVHGILAAPPCTEFASSGARWWKTKPSWKLKEALEVVRACQGIIGSSECRWWALENPVGRLPRFIGPYCYLYQPYEFGNPWTKKTCLWGNFQTPTKHPVEPTEGSKMHLMSPSPDRSAKRSVTPHGFAQAFFAANP